MNVLRMVTLAKFLETVKPENFDMNMWYNKKPCGTVACAAGWATTLEEFQAQGLTRNSDDIPRFDGYCGTGAMALFLDLETADAQAVFLPRSYYVGAIKPKHVAAKLWSFIRKHRRTVLADFLDDLDPENFNINVWMNTYDCKTVACAAGWATTIPEFRDQGLYSGPGSEPLFNPGSGLTSGVSAMAEFLGLNPRQSYSIFLPGNYPEPTTPAMVAEKLRRI